MVARLHSRHFNGGCNYRRCCPDLRFPPLERLVMGHRKSTRRVICYRKDRRVTLCNHHHMNEDYTIADDPDRVTCPACRRLLRRQSL